MASSGKHHLPKTQTHLGAQALLSFPVYLQLIEPLDPRCEVKLVHIARERRLPVLENRRVPSKEQEKERSFCDSQQPGQPRACRAPMASRASSAPPGLGAEGAQQPQPHCQGGRAVLTPHPLTRTVLRHLHECHGPPSEHHCASKPHNGTTKPAPFWNCPVLCCKPPQNHGTIKAGKAL